jgi:hypothetical protein
MLNMVCVLERGYTMLTSITPFGRGPTIVIMDDNICKGVTP